MNVLKVAPSFLEEAVKLLLEVVMTAAVKLKETDEMVTLVIDGKSHTFPVLIGSEGEHAIDISQLRKTTGYVTLDEGFVNTASCKSAITFLNGEKGILHYRGFGIEDLAKEQNFLETSYLVINGSKPSPSEFKAFSEQVSKHSETLGALKDLIKSFPKEAHPMGVLSSTLNSLLGLLSRLFRAGP